ncbi:transcriptional regulator PpsR [Hydrogenophaga luteola]|uniref:Transcriptional regulator PpsR n=1 Tax=Hydrogenophaga luteola TaxID=1591122 RepID=A0ABV7WA01_9BURK
MTQGIPAMVKGQFLNPAPLLADMSGDAVADLITAAADVVLILDHDGIIRDMALGSEDMLESGCQQWLGKSWAQTVTIESQPKIEALLKTQGALTNDGVRWRQVNQLLTDGADLPIAYSVAPIRSDRGISSVAFGRDLRPQVVLQQRLVTAQQTMERDYWRLRQIETRYRLLFQMASEPVLIFEGGLDKLEEANPAAYELLGDGARQHGWSLADSLHPDSLQDVQTMMERLRATGRSEPCQVRLVGSGELMFLAATQFRQDNRLFFLVRVTRPEAAELNMPAARQQLMHVMESAPDALVVTDTDGRILSVNRAFLDLGQLSTEEQARGELLDRWLGRTGVDFRVLLSNLRQHGTVRLFATQLRGEYGSHSEVEVSAVSVMGGAHPCLGFTIRDMGRRLSTDLRATKELPRSASQMTELVGRLPLKDIVRETTDLIEQLCIEAALELTGDNRASAAEMLGLSRQSLYIKLRRFGIIEGSSDDVH